MRAETFPSLLWRGAARFARLMAASLRAHAFLLGFIALFWAVRTWLLARYGVAQPMDFASLALGFLKTTMPILLIALVTVRFIHIAMNVRPKHPSVALVKDLAGFLASPVRLALGLPLLVSLSVFIHGFSDIKYIIPVIAPFSWDETFMEWDRWLHFGRHPWEWLQPVFGHPVLTLALNFFYNIWFIVMWMFWLTMAFALRPSALRTQFFTAFVLLWALAGNLAAMLLSSAGPCYYGLLGLSPDPFAPLMDYLRATNEVFPIWAVTTQSMLWDAYTGKQNVIAGISAMPSLHNASTLMFALAAWRLDRRFGAAMLVYALIILLGSVHLGWHYAIDGYIGWAMTAVIWWLSGCFARWHEQTAAAADLRKQCDSPMSNESSYIYEKTSTATISPHFANEA